MTSCWDRDGHNSKMNLCCNATPALNVLTSQHQIDHMVENTSQEDLGGDDPVSNNNLDRFEKFSIRKYVFSVRAKDIKKSWPFSQKYVQTCLENGRHPLLPPFESRNDILQEKLKIKENLASGNDIRKSNMIPDNSNKVKIEDSKVYKNGLYREGWVKKHRNHPTKKKMVPRKARNGQISRRNAKEAIVEGLVNVNEVKEAKGDTIEEKLFPRECNDKCQEIEKNLMISRETDAMSCVADTDLARSSELAIGEHGTGKITGQAIYKQQKNESESSDKHLNAKGGTEVRKKKRKKTVASKLKTVEDSKKEQAPEKNKDVGEKNDVFGNSISLPDALVPKVCPVCRTFSSTSNTALNAHIDRCLSVEANARKAGTKSAKPKVRTIKKRSLADICAVAPICTLEDLDQNTGEDQLAIDVNQLPSDGPMWQEKTKWRRHRQKVQKAHADSKGKKLRILSNLKEHLQPEENQQNKFPKRRKKVASTTLVQCSEGAANVQDSVSSRKLKKKVHVASSAKHAQIEETVKEKPTCSALGTACEEKPFASGNARIDTNRKKQMCLIQVAQEQESYNKNDKGLTDVQETTRSPLEEELHNSSSISALPPISNGQSIQITDVGQTNNETWPVEMRESKCSPLAEVSENSDCERKRHSSRLHPDNDMVQIVSRNELSSVSLSMEEESRTSAQSQCQAPTKPSESFEGVSNQPCEKLIETQSHSNSSVDISCQDSRITFTSHEASVVGEPGNGASVVGHDTVDVLTGTRARITGVSFQDLSNEGKSDPALCEKNEGKSSPLIFHENSNPRKAMQETVVPQENLGLNCVGTNDVAKEREKSMSFQKQVLKENVAAQNDISSLNSATDASTILSPSNRQFISFGRDPALSNLLNATTNICASSSSTYLYNGLIVEQSKSHSTRITSISENVNSNHRWIAAETEHSNPRSMQGRPQEPAQKFTNTSCGVFGDDLCSSSSTFPKGLPLTLQGNLLQKPSFQSKDSHHLNQQPSFANMKLTSVSVPQVVSASTLAKQLGEGKTAEEILHGCFMIEQSLSACNSKIKSNQTGQNLVHNISTNPLEKHVGSKQNLNNSSFGISNGSYMGNQVVGVAPYACTIQKRCSSNGRNFPSACLGSSGAAYSSGLVNNQGLDNINCFSEPSMFVNPTVRLMGKNLTVANTDGGQSKQPDTNPNSGEEFRNASYLRLLGFTSEENLLQDGNNQLGRSMESSINFDQDMFHTFEGVRSQESRLLWNRNGCSQKPTSAVGDFSEWLQNMAVSTYQPSSVEAALTSAGPLWSQSGLTNSNMKFSSPHVSTASVENRTSNRPAGVISQAKRQPSSAVHSQSDHAVIVIDDSPDVDAVPKFSGLEPTSFNARPNKFQEGNSEGGISTYDSICRSGKAWPQVSSIPSLFSPCKESTIARGSNLQRAKQVQAELRRLGITNPGNYGQPSFALHPQSEPEVIVIDDTPDEEAVSILPLLETASFNAQPRQFQEANYNSMLRSGNTWAPCVPTHFSACKESTLSCGLNHQRAKEVQAELRRLGITNPGIGQSSNSFLKPMRGGWANDLNNVL